MRNPKFRTIRPNYRKKVLEIRLQEGRKLTRYNLPFAALKGKGIRLEEPVRVYRHR